MGENLYGQNLYPITRLSYNFIMKALVMVIVITHIPVSGETEGVRDLEP